MLCDTDALTPDEVLSSRCASYDDTYLAQRKLTFQRLNDLHLLEERWRNAENYQLTETERETVSDVFLELAKYSRKDATPPLLANMTGSAVFTKEAFDDIGDELRLTENLPVKTFASHSEHPMDRPFTRFETFMQYAPSVYRARAIENSIARTVITKRGIRLQMPLLPSFGAWQGGRSQILWLTLHLIAAMCHRHRNVFLCRLFVLLRNLDFFILCTNCRWHWHHDGASEYVQYLANLPERIRKHLPIDVIIVQLHNRVAYRSSKYGRLDNESLVDVTFDYRKYVHEVLFGGQRYYDEQWLPSLSTDEASNVDLRRVHSYSLTHDRLIAGSRFERLWHASTDGMLTFH